MTLPVEPRMIIPDYGVVRGWEGSAWHRKCLHIRGGQEKSGQRVSSSSRGKTADPDIGKPFITLDTRRHFSTNQHF